MNSGKSGFTMVELLLIVAMISVLAAIAYPNYLESQIKAKVAQAKSGLKNLGTAMEAYYVDNDGYPGEYLTAGYDETTRNRRVYLHLTTPVAYLPEIPKDPLRASVADGTSYFNNPYFWYYNWLDRYGHLVNLAKDNNWDPWFGGQTAIAMISLGPSGRTVSGTGGIGFGTYDPTNGITSPGYLYRLLPGGRSN
jgi:prepilin-type N-terminal cleavage/methylation domain-containing protein